MLGAVKGNPETEGVPLFRLLARRWKSLAPVRHERTFFLSKPKKESKQARAWIEKPRNAIYAHQPVERPGRRCGWNPWLWVK